MEQKLRLSFIKGAERLSVWAYLLDQINVFPVADSDTGKNLVVSLSPLRQMNGSCEQIIQKLLESACGNSGNIAARFFSGLLTMNSLEQLCQASLLGRNSAWNAVLDPKPGTMLTVFDALIEILEQEIEFQADKIINHLKNAVFSTRELLPELKDAGVVDSGALGMFIFFEGFFKSIAENDPVFPSILHTFKDSLKISPEYINNYLDKCQYENNTGYCINTLIKTSLDPEKTPDVLSPYGESIIVSHDKELLKIHAHTIDKQALKDKIKSIGKIITWSEESLTDNIKNLTRKSAPALSGTVSYSNDSQVHIMTDAAGSFPRQYAQELCVTLLDSYIIAENQALPESHFDPSAIYQLMKKGRQVSTSQASVFERHQHYQKAVHQYQKVIYLCTGSVYTGNYNTAAAWKKDNDPENQMAVIDTGTASGKLGTIAIMCARYLSGIKKNPGRIIKFAENIIAQCEEYVFLDKLKYLAASGRLSKTGAFFGDMLNMKPVISPLSQGAKKVGMVKNQESQIKFALEKLETRIKKESSPFIMIEYTDNEQWINMSVKKQIQDYYPNAEIFICPLSLTSGVHMGPGTWSIAFVPEDFHF